MDILRQLTNDIAFRLRLQAKVSNLYEIQHPHMVRIPTIYEEAADEIERLRALVNRWETCELVAESLCDMDNPESFCDTCKEPF